MYKVSADREAGLFEQLITPLLKQRRAAAREEAVEMLEELAELADDLRAVMVRANPDPRVRLLFHTGSLSR
jgi:hypothetical protein